MTDLRAFHREALDVARTVVGAVGAEPAKVFGESAADVAAAFAEDGVPERGFWLPEIRDGRLFSASLAIGFHFVDTVVHAWDVAKSIGVGVEFDAPLLDAVLPI